MSERESVFDWNNPQHVWAREFMESVEAEQDQRARDAIERGRQSDDPGMPFEEFLRLHGLPRRGDDGL